MDGVPARAGADRLRLDVWSGVVCPWCYLGKRRLEAAIAAFGHGDHVQVVCHSFELDPGAPREAGDLVDRLADRYGMTREQAVAANDRVTALAAAQGLELALDRAGPATPSTRTG